MPSIFSGLNPISGSSLSSQDHEELNKLKTEVDKVKTDIDALKTEVDKHVSDTIISDEEYKEIKTYIFGSDN